MTQFLRMVMSAFPSARWEATIDILPVYVLRHGTRSRGNMKYSCDYPFVGSAKCFRTEVQTDRIWNEQLVPWQWFVVLVARPNDGVLLCDSSVDPDRNRAFFLVYADEDGTRYFKIPCEHEEELNCGFEVLRGNGPASVGPIQFKPEHWFDDAGEEAWEYVVNNGTIVSSEGEGQ